jgi:hypothetical protein
MQLPVDQRPALAGGVGEEHPELAVLDPTGGAGVLALRPGGLDTLLQGPGLVDDQHPARLTQVLDHIAAQVVTLSACCYQGVRK